MKRWVERRRWGEKEVGGGRRWVEREGGGWREGGVLGAQEPCTKRFDFLLT